MTAHDDSELTRVLQELGSAVDVAEVFPILYGELRRLAQRLMGDERPDHTLQATAVVNEAFVRLLGRPHEPWRDRAAFFRDAARCMRQLLVDHARSRGRQRRGGGRRRVPLEASDLVLAENRDDVLAVDEALRRLEQLDPQQCRVVEMRFFAGLTAEQTADALGLSERSVYREWRLAQAWLRAELGEDDDG